MRCSSARRASISESSPTGISAHERRSGDDAVREEGLAGRREEVALVATKREERQAVGAVRLDERPRDALLPHALHDRLPERTQPEVQRCEAEHDADCSERVGGAIREVVARDLDGEDKGDDRSESRAETEAKADAGGIARHVEPVPPTDESDEQGERDRRLLEVQSPREMGRGGRDDDEDRELPGAVTPSRERAREKDETDRTCHRQDASALRPTGRQHPVHEPHAVRHLRRRSRDDAHDTDRERGHREEPLRCEASQHLGQGTTSW